MVSKELTHKNICIICLLGNPFNLNGGGYQRTIHELIEYFKNTEWNFTIFTLNDTDINVTKNFIASNIVVNQISINSEWITNQNLLFDHRNEIIKQIKTILSELTIMPFVFHSFHWFSGYITSILSEEYNIPQIHNVIALSYERLINGIPLRCENQRYCEDEIFKHSEFILTISETEKQNLMNEYLVPNSKILLIGRSVEECFLSPSHDTCGNIHSLQKLNLITENITENQWWSVGAFCYFGRIIYYKGVKEILLAWEILYEKYHEFTPPLWIIGGDSDTISKYRKQCLTFIPKLDYYENIHKIYWWGYLDSVGISNLLLKCNLVIMHSHFEPGGRVVIESMAAGKPIIGTNCGFSKSFIKNWHNGFIVPYGNIKKLSDFMYFFIKNRYLSNMMGINGQYLFHNINKNWNYYKRIEDIYLYIFNNNNKFPSDVKLNDIIWIYPYKLDIFPYCDIKLTTSDIENNFHFEINKIDEKKQFVSYIWKIFSNNRCYIIKQYYNRLNIKQLWNPFDEHQVHTIWMLYSSTTYSLRYNTILPSVKYSEKLFSICIPYGQKVDLKNKMVHKNIKELLFTFHHSEKIDYPKCMKPEEELLFFKKLNEEIQFQHKYYTLRILLSELEIIINEHKFVQELNILLIIKKAIQNIPKIFGLLYGKTMIHHIVIWEKNMYLLPSADVYLGELGYDEAETYISLMNNNISHEKNLETILNISKISSQSILSWTAALLLEKIISYKILNIPNHEIYIMLESVLKMLDKAI